MTGVSSPYILGKQRFADRDMDSRGGQSNFSEFGIEVVRDRW